MRPVLVVLAACALVVPALPARAADRTVACGLAVEVVRHLLEGRPFQRLVFSAEPQTTFPRLDASEIVPLAKDRRPLAGGLAEAFAKDRSHNAVAECAQVRDLLNARNIPFDAEALADAKASHMPPRDRTAPRIDIVGVMLPVVSRDGRDALVETWNTCPGLCGMGSIWLYRRLPNGRWGKGSMVSPFWNS